VSPETLRFEDSAGGWSPLLSVVGRLHFDGRDVATGRTPLTWPGCRTRSATSTGPWATTATTDIDISEAAVLAEVVLS
jgi:hypothetical protein